MCVCACACVCVCVHACVCVCMCTCMCVCIQGFMCACVCVSFISFSLPGVKGRLAFWLAVLSLSAPLAYSTLQHTLFNMLLLCKLLSKQQTITMPCNSQNAPFKNKPSQIHACPILIVSVEIRLLILPNQPHCPGDPALDCRKPQAFSNNGRVAISDSGPVQCERALRSKRLTT